MAKRKKNSDILDAIFNDAPVEEEPKPKKRKRKTKKEKTKDIVDSVRESRPTNQEPFKPEPIQLLNTNTTIDTANVNKKGTVSTLTDLCSVFNIEYNGRHRADFPYDILVGLVDNYFNIYVQGEKVGTYKKNQIIKEICKLLEDQHEAQTIRIRNIKNESA